MTETLPGAPAVGTSVNPGQGPDPKTLQEQLNAPLDTNKKPEENPSAIAKTVDTTVSAAVDPDRPVNPDLDPKDVADKNPPKMDESFDTLEPYGDDAADAAVTMLKESGLTFEETSALFTEAAATGDLTKIDKATLFERLGKEKGQAVLALVTDFYNRNAGASKVIVDAAYNSVGGKAQFEKLAAWATKARANPETAAKLDELNKMIDIGAGPAVMAVGELVKLFNADPNNRSLNVRMLNGDSTVGTESFEPISRMDYADAMELANKKGDYKAMDTLRQRRTATINAERAKR